MIKTATEPFDNPDFRNILIDIKRENEQIIDTVSLDEVLEAGASIKSKEKALEAVGRFKKFLEENKDELIALQILYNQPYKKTNVTLKQIKELSDAIKKPPYCLNHELIWHAYEAIEKNKVRNGSPVKQLTNLVSLVRFATGKTDVLLPFPKVVVQKFNEWIE